MWWLAPKTAEPEGVDRGVCLLVDKEYIVGRKDCPILIKDDPSISRKHAVITVTYNRVDLADPSNVPEVIVKDSSKYGTFVGGTKIEVPTKLKNRDEIAFGTHGCCHRLSYKPVVIVTSCLENSKKKILKKQMHMLGGHMMNDWKHGHSTHLIMDGLTFTIKVIHALAGCCPIVIPEYINEIIKAAETNSPLPDTIRFLPPLKEETIKSDGPNFLPDVRRKTLFSGKNFIFLSRKQYNRTYKAVEMCGGKTLLRETADSIKDKSSLCADESCIMMVDSRELDSLPSDARELTVLAMDMLKKNRKRPIPESELGLAILRMSLEKYCNPNMDAVPVFTQNIVCQSLQLGPEEMSQVFSQQHTEHTKESKKPIPPVKGHGDQKTKPFTVKHEAEAKTSVIDTVLETQTHSQNDTHSRKGEVQVKKEAVAETQSESQSPQLPRFRNRSGVIPDSISEITAHADKAALAAETPLDETMDQQSKLHRNGNQKGFVADSVFQDTTRMEVSALASDTLNESFDKKKQVSPVLANQPDAIPESMDFENESFMTGKKHPRSSSSSETSRGFASGWKSSKRARILDSDGSQATDVPMPLKRSLKQESELEREDGEEVVSRKNAAATEGITKKSFCVQGGDSACETDEPESESNGRTLVGSRPVVIPEGYLSSRIPRKQIKAIKEEDEDDGLPRNLVVVDEVSLVVRRPRGTRQPSHPTTSTVRNFKKFRKQRYPGCATGLPRIIGGSDLVVFENTSGVEQEDWFVEAREENMEQELLDRQAEELFMMEPQTTRGRKRR